MFGTTKTKLGEFRAHRDGSRWSVVEIREDGASDTVAYISSRPTASAQEYRADAARQEETARRIARLLTTEAEKD